MQPETLKNIKSDCLNLSNDFRILTKQMKYMFLLFLNLCFHLY
jgi:hypothetical protein